MDGGIFGCGDPTIINGATRNGGYGDKIKVCGEEKAGTPCNLQTFRQAQGFTFSIILPNTIHGSKKHF